jgi:ribosome-binding protein aMBF1 (putative translation factor)
MNIVTVKRKYVKSGKPRKPKGLTDLSKLKSGAFRITELKILPGTNVGMALRQARKSLGISASAVARSIGYDVCNINHFELGTGTSGGKYLTETGLKYAKAIGIKKISFII